MRYSEQIQKALELNHFFSAVEKSSKRKVNDKKYYKLINPKKNERLN